MTQTIQTEEKYASKTIKALNLMDQGIDPKTALQITNFKPIISPNAVTNLKKKYEKWSLKSPKTVKLAHRAVLDCLAGETSEIKSQKIDRNGQVVEITETIAPTVTNKLAAAAMVYDRYEPVVRQNLNVNVNQDVHPVDLSRYQNSQSGGPGAQDQAIDADYGDSQGQNSSSTT